MNRVEAIIFHEQSADELQAKSDEHRWEAARLIAEELDSGKSRSVLAREIGKSRQHTMRMERAWKLYLKVHSAERPPFNQVYNSPEVRAITAAPAANFRLMPRLRLRRKGNQLILDLSEYRATVRDLVSIYPEDLQPIITDLYEHVIEGIYAVGASGYTLDLDKFAQIADERIKAVVGGTEKLLRRCGIGNINGANFVVPNRRR